MIYVYDITKLALMTIKFGRIKYDACGGTEKLMKFHILEQRFPNFFNRGPPIGILWTPSH